MFKEKLEQLKNMFKGGEENNKKKLQNLIFLLCLLVITIIAINVIWNDDKDNEKSFNSQLVHSENTTTNEIKTNESEYNLQDSLKNILSKISGAGSVDVLLTYTKTSELVPIYNETSKQSITQENDTSGNIRTIEQNDSNKEVAYSEQNGKKQAITQKIIMPQVEGAIVLAEGAENAEVKNNIIQAVEAVTGLSIHKIQVFKLSV